MIYEQQIRILPSLSSNHSIDQLLNLELSFGDLELLLQEMMENELIVWMFLD